MESPEISLIHFVKMHYGVAYRKHASNHDHTQLPLKDTSAVPNFQYFTGIPFIQFGLDSYVIIHILSWPSEEATIQTCLYHKIWQPPEVC
jgi:hypothetical protein